MWHGVWPSLLDTWIKNVYPEKRICNDQPALRYRTIQIRKEKLTFTSWHSISLCILTDICLPICRSHISRIVVFITATTTTTKWNLLIFIYDQPAISYNYVKSFPPTKCVVCLCGTVCYIFPFFSGDRQADRQSEDSWPGWAIRLHICLFWFLNYCCLMGWPHSDNCRGEKTICYFLVCRHFVGNGEHYYSIELALEKNLKNRP